LDALNHTAGRQPGGFAPLSSAKIPPPAIHPGTSAIGNGENEMTRNKTVEFTVKSDENGKILIEHIVNAYVNNYIGDGALLIAIDSDGAVFEWRQPMTPEEEEKFLEEKRAKEEAEAAVEADDRKLGF
jgi:hypothetical protein